LVIYISMPEAPVIAFDFDGVIASYHGYVAKNDVQEPIAEVVKAIKLLKERNFKILIHSTRGDEFLKKYCEQFSIPFDYINHRPDREGENSGKPIAFAYVDDRAICYKGENAETLVSGIVNFKPYWQK
jgi:capsule polysaccharide export protein KpsC/LpsZ